MHAHLRPAARNLQANIALQSRVGYVTDGNTVMQFNLVSLRYLRSTHGICDILACIPFDMIQARSQ